MKKIYIVVGTRPNFIKVTQFKKEAIKKFDVKLIHTGQHYDEKMSKVFFQQFNMQPDVTINLSTSSVNAQIAEIITKLEELFVADKPDCIVVVGDVNSTLAASLVANKMNIPLAHVESGLRSFDRTMPEEINRIITDELADLYFITEQSGIDNLIAEGKDASKIKLVGNTMIDTMLAFENEIEASKVLELYNIANKPFILTTMHRPATVDNEEGLKKLLDLLKVVTQHLTVFFPVHPRTLGKLKAFNLEHDYRQLSNLIIAEPQDYFAFQKLVKYATVIITDSGGIQEESTQRQVPCLTLRPNTERPITITVGTNTLIDFDKRIVEEYIQNILNGRYKKGSIPNLWDGKATHRIVEVLDNWLN